MKQNMIQWFRSLLGSSDKNGQILLGLLLSNIFVQGLWAQSHLAAVLLQKGLSDNGFLINIVSKINAQLLTSSKSKRLYLNGILTLQTFRHLSYTV